MSKNEPEEKVGLFWGYSVRAAHNIKSVFKGEEPYTKTILVDSKIKSKSKYPKLQSRLPELSSEDRVLLLFAGYDGLESMIENDEGCKVSMKEIVEQIDSIF